MAIIWADGFDDWTSATGEYSSSNNITISAGQGRRSTDAMLIDGSQDHAQKDLPSSLSELYAAMAVKCTDAQAGTLITFASGATEQVRISANADGSIEAFRGSTSLGASSPGLFAQGVYFHIQIRVVIHDSAGVVQVRIDGSASESLSLTGADTNDAGGGVCSAVRIGSISGRGSRDAYIDDFVIWDTTGSVANAWLGDVRVDTLFPSGNGDSSQFVGSDSNSTDNYLLVDGAAPNTTDYVQSDVDTNKDLYAMGNLTHAPASIFGVVATASALKDDAGTAAIALRCKSGATETAGSDQALSTSRARYVTVYETDPDTAAAWTVGGVDAAQIGVEAAV